MVTSSLETILLTVKDPHVESETFLERSLAALGNAQLGSCAINLQPFVPHGTELDFMNGKTYVSIVGFMFQDARILGWRVPGHIDFSEVNLRFYVTHSENGVTKRGVSFISEIVPRIAIAAVARLIYNEPYVALPMQNVIIEGPRPGVTYKWKKHKWMGFSLQYDSMLCELMPNSIESFIAEHYFGYTSQRDGSTIEYQLDHVPWKYHEGRSLKIDPSVADFYPSPFRETLSRPPDNIFLAEGSPVLVYKPRPIY